MCTERASKSICYKKATGCRSFHECTTANNATCFVHDEIRKAKMRLANVPAIELEMRVEELIDGAKRGVLHRMSVEKYDTLAKPCARQPDIWELRIRTTWGGLFRLYYSEKEDRDPEFVALCFQEKETSGRSDDDIRTQQNQAIDIAQERFSLYSNGNWGHVAKSCQYCV